MQWMILQGKDGESIGKAATFDGNRSPNCCPLTVTALPHTAAAGMGATSQGQTAGFCGPADLFEDIKGSHHLILQLQVSLSGTFQPM